MRRHVPWLALAALAGCAAETADDAGAQRYELVSPMALEGRLYHYVPGELGLSETASEGSVPVRLEFLETIATAWFAPEGEAQILPGNILAVYPFSRVAADVQALGGSVDDTGADILVPGGNAGTPHVARERVELDVPGASTLDAKVPTRAIDTTNYLERVMIDWRDRIPTDDIAFRREIDDFHPGCI